MHQSISRSRVARRKSMTNSRKIFLFYTPLEATSSYVCCILSEELRFLREFLLVSSSFSYSVIYLSCFKLSIREPVHLPFTAVL